MTETADQQSIAQWFEAWGACVAAVDFDAAKPMFADDVVGFGTHRAVFRGLETMAAEQWGQVWPTIRDFRFLTGELVCLVSPDRLQATAVLPWASTGVHEDGTTFDRPGRATVVLTRAGLDAPWRGRHTHFSLNPGTPGRSHGRR